MTYPFATHVQKAGIIPRTILITKSSSKIIFGSKIIHLQHNFFYCHVLLPSEHVPTAGTDSQLHDILSLQVRSYPAVAGPINRPTQCTLIDRSNSLTTLLLRTFKQKKKK
jgi:hypothetical protein